MCRRLLPKSTHFCRRLAINSIPTSRRSYEIAKCIRTNGRLKKAGEIRIIPPIYVTNRSQITNLPVDTQILKGRTTWRNLPSIFLILRDFDHLPRFFSVSLAQAMVDIRVHASKPASYALIPTFHDKGLAITAPAGYCSAGESNLNV
jgi:hypothetical protein